MDSVVRWETNPDTDFFKAEYKDIYKEAVKLHQNHQSSAESASRK